MTTQHSQDEVLDLVDAHDQVVGKVVRHSKEHNASVNFRVINAFLVNSKGQLWIPRRAPGKRIFPNCLDMSVGGHVDSGEDYETAFRRETAEELNIDIDGADWKEIGYLNPYEVGTSAFMKVYRIDTDRTPDYNKDDFTEAFWLSPEQVIERVIAGEPVKGDLGQLVRLFFISKDKASGT